MLTLVNEQATADILPDLGASLLGFRVGGVDVLRRGTPDSADPRTMGSFVMAPYCGRVERGVFDFDGVRVELARNVEGETHPLHGDAWLSRWEVESVEDSTATLTMTHPANSWPWRYRTGQRFVLEPERLTVELSITNLSSTDMPYGLGFHPYFARPARLSATVDGLWDGEDLLPDQWSEHDALRNVDIDTLIMDRTFTGWDGRAVLETDFGRVTVQSDLRNLHLFSPRGRNVFSVEPVTAAPDAPNHPDRGLRRLAPGETGSSWMRIALGG